MKIKSNITDKTRYSYAGNWSDFEKYSTVGYDINRDANGMAKLFENTQLNTHVLRLLVDSWDKLAKDIKEVYFLRSKKSARRMHLAISAFFVDADGNTFVLTNAQ